MSDALDTCHVKVQGEWIAITINKALSLHPERTLRCPECQGQVRAHKASEDGVMRAHFEHRVAHEGCSRGYCFKGHRSQHPKAVA